MDVTKDVNGVPNSEEEAHGKKKRLRFPNKYMTIGVIAFVVIALSIWFYYTFFQKRSLYGFLGLCISSLRPFIIGAALAYVLKPICAVFEKWFGKIFAKINNRRTAKNLTINFSIGCTAILFCTLVYVLFAAVIPQVIDSITTIVGLIPSWGDNIVNWAQNITKGNPKIQAQITDMTNNFSANLVDLIKTFLEKHNGESIFSNFTNSIKSVLLLLKDLMVGGVSCIYILHERKKFAVQGKMVIYGVFKEKWADKIMEELNYTDKMFSGFVNGKLIDSIIIGLICFVVTSICRIPYAILISAIVGVTNIIPFFGPFIGAIPSAIIILMISPLKCLYFVIIIIIIQQFDGNILGPKILGNSTGLSSFWVLFSITFFGGLWGFIGMVIGVPVFAVIYDIVRRLIQKGLRKREKYGLYDNYEEDKRIERQEKAEGKARRVSRMTRFKGFEMHKAEKKEDKKKK